MTWWLRAVCSTADGPAAHVDHVLLSSVDMVAADLVYTHVDRTGVVAQTVLTARVPPKPTTAELAALTERLGSPVTLTEQPGSVPPPPGEPHTSQLARQTHHTVRPSWQSGHADQPTRATNPPAEPATSASLSGEPDPSAGDPPDGARCVRFPGQESLTGIHPAADLVARSAIDEVVGVGVPVTPGGMVDTRGFLRPTFAAGRLVLLVEPAAGGALRPVEIADPHECCGGH